MTIFFKYLTFTWFFLLVKSFNKQQEFTLYSSNADTPIDLIFSAPPHEMNLSITPSSVLSLKTSNRSILSYDPNIDRLNTTFNLKVGNDINLQDELSDIFFIDSKQWKLAFFEDFQGSALGWSEVSKSSCGTSPNLFLGGFILRISILFV